jgi:putative FmdB family regulatory protein
MPVYQYLCPSCNHKFELRQSFNDECHASCPKCNNGAKRIFVPVPIIFKGSGFYVTDSSKKSEVQDSPKQDSSKQDKPTEAKKEEKKETPKAVARETPNETSREAKVDKKAEAPVAKAS